MQHPPTWLLQWQQLPLLLQRNMQQLRRSKGQTWHQQQLPQQPVHTQHQHVHAQHRQQHRYAPQLQSPSSYPPVNQQQSHTLMPSDRRLLLAAPPHQRHRSHLLQRPHRTFHSHLQPRIAANYTRQHIAAGPIIQRVPGDDSAEQHLAAAGQYFSVAPAQEAAPNVAVTSTIPRMPHGQQNQQLHLTHQESASSALRKEARRHRDGSPDTAPLEPSARNRMKSGQAATTTTRVHPHRQQPQQQQQQPTQLPRTGEEHQKHYLRKQRLWQQPQQQQQHRPVIQQHPQEEVPQFQRDLYEKRTQGSSGAKKTTSGTPTAAASLPSPGAANYSSSFPSATTSDGWGNLQFFEALALGALQVIDQDLALSLIDSGMLREHQHMRRQQQQHLQQQQQNQQQQEHVGGENQQQQVLQQQLLLQQQEQWWGNTQTHQVHFQQSRGRPHALKAAQEQHEKRKRLIKVARANVLLAVYADLFLEGGSVRAATSSMSNNIPSVARTSAATVAAASTVTVAAPASTSSHPARSSSSTAQSTTASVPPPGASMPPSPSLPGPCDILPSSALAERPKEEVRDMQSVLRGFKASDSDGALHCSTVLPVRASASAPGKNASEETDITAAVRTEAVAQRASPFDAKGSSVRKDLLPSKILPCADPHIPTTTAVALEDVDRKPSAAVPKAPAPGTPGAVDNSVASAAAETKRGASPLDSRICVTLARHRRLLEEERRIERAAQQTRYIVTPLPRAKVLRLLDWLPASVRAASKGAADAALPAATTDSSNSLLSSPYRTVPAGSHCGECTDVLHQKQQHQQSSGLFQPTARIWFEFFIRLQQLHAHGVPLTQFPRFTLFMRSALLMFPHFFDDPLHSTSFSSVTSALPPVANAAVDTRSVVHLTRSVHPSAITAPEKCASQSSETAVSTSPTSSSSSPFSIPSPSPSQGRSPAACAVVKEAPRDLWLQLAPAQRRYLLHALGQMNLPHTFLALFRRELHALPVDGSSDVCSSALSCFSPAFPLLSSYPASSHPVGDSFAWLASCIPLLRGSALIMYDQLRLPRDLQAAIVSLTAAPRAAATTTQSTGRADATVVGNQVTASAPAAAASAAQTSSSVFSSLSNPSTAAVAANVEIAGCEKEQENANAALTLTSEAQPAAASAMTTSSGPLTTIRGTPARTSDTFEGRLVPSANVATVAASSVAGPSAARVAPREPFLVFRPPRTLDEPLTEVAYARASHALLSCWHELWCRMQQSRTVSPETKVRFFFHALPWAPVMQRTCDDVHAHMGKLRLHELASLACSVRIRQVYLLRLYYYLRYLQQQKEEEEQQKHELVMLQQKQRVQQAAVPQHSKYKGVGWQQHEAANFSGGVGMRKKDDYAELPWKQHLAGAPPLLSMHPALQGQWEHLLEGLNGAWNLFGDTLLTLESMHELLTDVDFPWAMAEEPECVWLRHAAQLRVFADGDEASQAALASSSSQPSSLLVHARKHQKHLEAEASTVACLTRATGGRQHQQVEQTLHYSDTKDSRPAARTASHGQHKQTATCHSSKETAKNVSAAAENVPEAIDSWGAELTPLFEPRSAALIRQEPDEWLSLPRAVVELERIYCKAGTALCHADPNEAAEVFQYWPHTFVALMEDFAALATLQQQGQCHGSQQQQRPQRATHAWAAAEETRFLNKVFQHIRTLTEVWYMAAVQNPGLRDQGVRHLLAIQQVLREIEEVSSGRFLVNKLKERPTAGKAGYAACLLAALTNCQTPSASSLKLDTLELLGTWCFRAFLHGSPVWPSTPVGAPFVPVPLSQYDPLRDSSSLQVVRSMIEQRRSAAASAYLASSSSSSSSALSLCSAPVHASTSVSTDRAAVASVADALSPAASAGAGALEYSFPPYMAFASSPVPLLTYQQLVSLDTTPLLSQSEMSFTFVLSTSYFFQVLFDAALRPPTLPRNFRMQHQVAHTTASGTTPIRSIARDRCHSGGRGDDFGSNNVLHSNTGNRTHWSDTGDKDTSQASHNIHAGSVETATNKKQGLSDLRGGKQWTKWLAANANVDAALHLPLLLPKLLHMWKRRILAPQQLPYKAFLWPEEVSAVDSDNDAVQLPYAAACSFATRGRRRPLSRAPVSRLKEEEKRPIDFPVPALVLFLCRAARITPVEELVEEGTYDKSETTSRRSSSHTCPLQSQQSSTASASVDIDVVDNSNVSQRHSTTLVTEPLPKDVTDTDTHNHCPSAENEKRETEATATANEPASGDGPPSGRTEGVYNATEEIEGKDGLSVVTESADDSSTMDELPGNEDLLDLPGEKDILADLGLEDLQQYYGTLEGTHTRAPHRKTAEGKEKTESDEAAPAAQVASNTSTGTIQHAAVLTSSNRHTHYIATEEEAAPPDNTRDLQFTLNVSTFAEPLKKLNLATIALAMTVVDEELQCVSRVCKTVKEMAADEMATTAALFSPFISASAYKTALTWLYDAFDMLFALNLTTASSFQLQELVKETRRLTVLPTYLPFISDDGLGAEGDLGGFSFKPASAADNRERSVEDSSTWAGALPPPREISPYGSTAVGVPNSGKAGGTPTLHTLETPREYAHTERSCYFHGAALRALLFRLARVHQTIGTGTGERLTAASATAGAVTNSSRRLFCKHTTGLSCWVPAASHSHIRMQPSISATSCAQRLVETWQLFELLLQMLSGAPATVREKVFPTLLRETTLQEKGDFPSDHLTAFLQPGFQTLCDVLPLLSLSHLARLALIIARLDLLRYCTAPQEDVSLFPFNGGFYDAPTSIALDDSIQHMHLLLSWQVPSAPVQRSFGQQQNVSGIAKNKAHKPPWQERRATSVSDETLTQHAANSSLGSLVGDSAGEKTVGHTRAKKRSAIALQSMLEAALRRQLGNHGHELPFSDVTMLLWALTVMPQPKPDILFLLFERLESILSLLLKEKRFLAGADNLPPALPYPTASPIFRYLQGQLMTHCARLRAAWASLILLQSESYLAERTMLTETYLSSSGLRGKRPPGGAGTVLPLVQFLLQALRKHGIQQEECALNVTIPGLPFRYNLAVPGRRLLFIVGCHCAHSPVTVDAKDPLNFIGHIIADTVNYTPTAALAVVQPLPNSSCTSAEVKKDSGVLTTSRSSDGLQEIAAEAREQTGERPQADLAGNVAFEDREERPKAPPGPMKIERGGGQDAEEDGDKGGALEAAEAVGTEWQLADCVIGEVQTATHSAAADARSAGGRHFIKRLTRRAGYRLVEVDISDAEAVDALLASVLQRC